MPGMMLFTFYPCRSDGAAIALEAHELAGDDAALVRASGVLADHPSAVEVVVWQGDRQIGAVVRERVPA
jgi:hypothetical protein